MGLVVSRPWPSQLIQAVERASQEAKRFSFSRGGGLGSVPGKYPEKVKYVLNLCFSVQVLCFPKKECDSMWRLSGWSWSLRFSGWPLSGIRIKSPHCHWGQQHPNWKRTGINCLRRLRDNSIEERSWFKQTTNPWSLLWRTVSCVLRRGCNSKNAIAVTEVWA